MENNKYLPHLYNPYFERMDVKAHMLEILEEQGPNYQSAPPTKLKKPKPKQNNEITIETMLKSDLMPKRIEIEAVDRLASEIN